MTKEAKQSFLYGVSVGGDNFTDRVKETRRLKMNFENPLSILTLAAMSIDDYSDKGYSVTYDCTLKAGCFSKRLQDTKVPIATLKKMFEK